MAPQDHDFDQLRGDIADGLTAASAARACREELRWSTRRGDDGRDRAIERALARVEAAMKPIRSHRGRAVWVPLPDSTEADLVEASDALQYERRQLKKML